MKKISIILLLLFTILVSYSYSQNKKPKYIFLFIGDGMGLNHISLTESFLSDSIGFQRLVMSNFPIFGLCETQCKNKLITESGAAGSAIACGEKANFETISYYNNPSEKNESIAKILHKKNYKIGIISTTNLNDATPSAFYAICNHRKKYYDITVQAPSSGFEFFGGGAFRIDTTDKRNYNFDVFDSFKENGYKCYSDLKLVDYHNDKKIIFTNKDILKDGEMPYSIDKNYSRDSLCKIVETAIKFLYNNNNNGFFIMCEGGKIDWAAHENDAATIISEVIDFEAAIKKAYKFYSEHPDETLIIVTADHETGGLSLGIARKKYETDFNILNLQKCSQYEFATKIENYKNFNSKYDLKDIIRLAEDNFYKEKITFNNEEYAEINKAFDVYFNEKIIKMSKEEKMELYGDKDYNPISVAFTRILNNRAGVGFTTWEHTAAKVPVWTIGNGATKFSGIMDNSEIKFKIISLVE